MVLIQERRKSGLYAKILDSTPTASNLGIILGNSTSPSFRTVYVRPGFLRHNVQGDVKTPAHVSESKDEGSLFLPTQGQDPTPTLPKSIAVLLNNAELRAMIQKFAREEGKRIHSSRVEEQC